MRVLGLVFSMCVPVLAAAQASVPTEFPAGAVELQQEDLQKRLSGKVSNMKYANGADVRVEFKDQFAYTNVGPRSDSGPWRVEGSKLCIDWRQFPSGCSEVRAVGDMLYVKRFSNGEIVQMPMK